MNKPTKIEIKGLLLLLIFVIGNNFFGQWHNHTNNILSPCGKSYKFSESKKSENCHHKSHINEPNEKCEKCNSLKVNYYFFEVCQSSFKKLLIFHKYIDPLIEFTPQFILRFSNKGPPTIA